MKMLIDFKKYRTYSLLLDALMLFTDRTRKGNNFRFRCIYEKCPARGNFSVKTIGKAPVAYCFGCHKTYDALEIVKVTQNTSYPEAASQLDLFVPAA